LDRRRRPRLLEHRVERRRAALDDLLDLRLNLREPLLELAVPRDLLRCRSEVAAAAAAPWRADHRPNHPAETLVQLYRIAERVLTRPRVVHVDQRALDHAELCVELLGRLDRRRILLRVRA